MASSGSSGHDIYQINEYEDGTRATAFNDYSGEYSGDFQYRHRRTSLHRNFRTPTRSNGNRSSWVDTAATLSRSPLDEHADHIVAKIGEDVELTADTWQASQLRKEALRDMPQSLTMKRLVKQKLEMNLNQRTKKDGIGFFQRIIYSLSIFFTKCRNLFTSFFYTFELWYKSLKKIEGEFGSAVATFFRFFRWLFLLDLLTFIPCLIFIIIPQTVFEKDTNLDDFSGADLFTGDGSFKNSLLFYGFYSNETYTMGGTLTYVMPHAYFYTMICLYIVNFIILSISTSRSYRKNFIETKGGLKNIFAHKIFSGWDYGIATSNAAKLKTTAIYNELRELMQEFESETVTEAFWDKFTTYGIRFSLNGIIMLGLSGVGYGMWMLLDENRKNIDNSGYAVVNAVVINAIMFVVPFFFTAVLRYENYENPRTGFYITLIRTFLLELIVIGISVSYWIIHSEEEKEGCWETSLGQEMYRLIIFDFIFSIIFHTLTEIIRKVVSTKWNFVKTPEFDIARYALQLVYNQTLFWVGLYFSPLITVVTIVKLFLTWYLITEIVLRVCNPSSKTWRASHTQTGFLIMSFISLILVLVTLGYVITSVRASSCGPFGGLDYVHDIIKEGIMNMRQGNMLWQVIIYLTKPGSFALMLLCMCVVIYYLREKAKAQDSMVNMLRDMHISEAKDKEFLLQRISQITKGRFNLHDMMAEPDVTSPLAYSYIKRKYREYGDHDIDAYSSELLLPSNMSTSSIPLRELFDNYKEDDYDNHNSIREVGMRYQQFGGDNDEVELRYKQIGGDKIDSDKADIEEVMKRFNIFEREDVEDVEVAKADVEEVKERFKKYDGGEVEDRFKKFD